MLLWQLQPGMNKSQTQKYQDITLEPFWNKRKKETSLTMAAVPGTTTAPVPAPGTTAAPPVSILLIFALFLHLTNIPQQVQHMQYQQLHQN